MDDIQTNFPRLHSEFLQIEPTNFDLGIPALKDACESISRLTGFGLEFTDASSDEDSIWSTEVGGMYSECRGRLSIRSRSARPDSDLQETTRLIEALAQLSLNLATAHGTLAERETELATKIPVVARAGDAKQLTSQLQSVLRGLCEGLDCKASAVYLLDDSTSTLKLRTQWGLPNLRFVEPARPLRGAVADLEALTGHAVVIEDCSLLKHWNVPESFASAVCVPISSSTTLLGTLWIFCDRVRDFTPGETNLVEIVAGRVTSELERSVLLEDKRNVKRYERMEDELIQWQQDRMLLVPPVIPGWEIAGAAVNSMALSRDFFHWRVLANDKLGIGIGSVSGSEGSGMLATAAIQASLQTQLMFRTRPHDLMQNLNDFAWTNSPGDHFASMFFGEINTRTGRLEFANAGSSDAYILRPHGWEPLSDESPMLGIEPDANYGTESSGISEGDILLLISDRNFPGSQHFEVAVIAETLLRHIDRSAREIADLAVEMISCHVGEADSPCVVVAKRHDSQLCT